MDDNRDELIVLLGTRIGVAMEDVVVVALQLGSAAPGQQDEHIELIVSAVSELSNLADALDALRE